MSSPGNVNNLSQSITKGELEDMLNNSVMKEEQKNLVRSIFDIASQNDDELSIEDWNNFVKGTDTNNDGTITDTEWKKSSFRKFKFERVADFYNIIQKFINNNYSAEVENENGSVNVLYTAINPHRAKPKNQGSFEGNWLLHDSYNSQTYDEWLENNGYVFNEPLANEIYDNVRNKDYNITKEDKNRLKHIKNEEKTRETYKGKCAKSVRESLEHITVYDDNQIGPYIFGESHKGEKLLELEKRPLNAYQYAEVLSNNPHLKEIPHNIVATMDLGDLPRGCIMVYDGNYKYSPNAKTKEKIYHEPGHLSSLKGEDKKDSGGGEYYIVDKEQATHIRVFVPIIETRKNEENMLAEMRYNPFIPKELQ